MDAGMTAGVVGAGLMGAEIALVFALGGHAVVLNDLAEAALERGTARIATVLRDAYASRGPARSAALGL
jgi:3-hydroxybutyryl-CoA dehydrogenase